MKKRQKKKKWKKETPKEYQRCENCGRTLDCFNKYHMRYGACNVSCYAQIACADIY